MSEENHRHNEGDAVVSSRSRAIKASRVQGIGGTTGKTLALALIGGAVYGVIKLIDRVTE